MRCLKRVSPKKKNKRVVQEKPVVDTGLKSIQRGERAGKGGLRGRDHARMWPIAGEMMTAALWIAKTMHVYRICLFHIAHYMLWRVPILNKQMLSFLCLRKCKTEADMLLHIKQYNPW